MNDAGCGATAGERLEQGKLTELVLPRRQFPGSRVIFIVLFVILLLLIEYASVLLNFNKQAPLLVGLGYFTLWYASTIAANFIVIRRLNAILRANPQADLPELAQAIRRGGVMLPVSAFNMLTWAVQRVRGNGFAIRVRGRVDGDGIDPIGFPFEPTPLNDTLPSFQGLAIDERRRGVGAHLPDNVRRYIELSGGWLQNAVIGSLGAYFIYLVYEQVLDLNEGIVFLGVLVYFRVALSRGAHGGRRQWLVVPGALMIRAAQRHQNAWKLTFIRRDEAVLCVVLRRGSAARAFLHCSSGRYLATMTRREADFLLRAWLSPVPPPEPKQLAELA